MWQYLDEELKELKKIDWDGITPTEMMSS